MDTRGSHTETRSTHTDTRAQTTHQKMSSAQSHFFQMSVAGFLCGRAGPVHHGRTVWPENAVGASDGVIHSRIFTRRVEPHSVRKDTVHRRFPRSMDVVPSDARCLCISMFQCVHQYVVYFWAWVSAPHAQLDTASSARTSPDSPSGCVGLTANGADPRRCTAGVTPASVRIWDRRTEARTGPGPLCPRNGRPHPSFPGVT